MRGRTWPTKAAAVLVAIVACGPTAPALAQKPVKIGVLTPLSPPGDASAGQFIVRGAKMAADDVNARGGVLGGRKIELVTEDDSGTPEKGVAGFRKRSEEHTSELQSRLHLVCRLLLEKKKNRKNCDTEHQVQSTLNTSH